MRALLLPLLPVPTLAPAAPPAQSVPVFGTKDGRCIDRDVQYAAGQPAVAGARRLGDLPPASHYLAVDRKVDGCRTPIVVRTGIGAR